MKYDARALSASELAEGSSGDYPYVETADATKYPKDGLSAVQSLPNNG